MSKGRGKAGFSESTKSKLAQRAGYQCSVPECLVRTVGPGAGDTEVASVGRAAHIHSAALNGPRGRGSLTEKELADIANGIWCCATHADEIDANSGRGFSVAELRSWKAVREDAARRERSGISAGPGWISNLTIAGGPLFKPGQVLDLGKATVLKGGSYGKTAILEWLGSVSGEDCRVRWGRACRRNTIRLELAYDARGRRYRLEYSDDGVNTSYVLNNVIAHSPPGNFSLVHLREDHRRLRPDTDHLGNIARSLGVRRNLIAGLTSEIARNGHPDFRSLHFKEEDAADWELPDNWEGPFYALYANLGASSGEQILETLSGSEMSRVFIEFAAAAARERAREVPALLLLDGGGWNLDEGSLADVGQFLLLQPFQTVLAVNHGADPNRNDIWKSWKHAAIARPDASRLAVLR